eukprot:TRINITY_DN30405_c0_g1_i1.p1 TRINITY_DN30405_c0_g1~~TRINITY_DN30405_c0_g1_i1.p1  ORF type:complete len:428 (-),score=56.41 TRINITY_DN30405_c0_g1_i1:37-1206(-)
MAFLKPEARTFLPSPHKAVGARSQVVSYTAQPDLRSEAASSNDTSTAFAAAAVSTALALVAAADRRRLSQLKARGGQQETVTLEQDEEKVETADDNLIVGTAGTATLTQEKSFSMERAVRRMWTKADFLHVHAVSGAVHTLIGLAYLVDVVVGDIVKLNGGTWSDHVPFEVVLMSLAFGALNAVSGLQVSLLPRPFNDLAQLLGLGENGNLQAAGFINTAVFYFSLTYQSLRVLPSYPDWLEPFDSIFAAVTLIAIFHAIFIINSWVDRDKLSRGFALGMSAPLLLNLPVSLHLLFQGQSWVEQLTKAYPGWPEVFFSSNYALGWAGSMVTLILSLYERRVINVTERMLLTVALGAITFTVIPLRALLLVPSWFNGDQMVMLTLTPPTV